MQPSATGATPGEPATVDLSGRCVGNSYVLICPVGHGATGTVWRGVERSTGAQVAVKLLHEGLLRQPKLVTRFVQERTILMMVRHEHIVGVLRHRCGPVELQAPRGRRYVVVQSWRYTGRSLLPGGSARSPEFTW